MGALERHVGTGRDAFTIDDILHLPGLFREDGECRLKLFSLGRARAIAQNRLIDRRWEISCCLKHRSSLLWVWGGLYPVGDQESMDGALIQSKNLKAWRCSASRDREFAALIG